MSFYYRRSYWNDWRIAHQIGLSSAQTLGDHRAEAWMLNNLGMAHGVQSNEESINCFEQARTLCRRTGDAQGEARASTNLANAYLNLGQFEQAQTVARKYLEGPTRNSYSAGIAWNVLGCACRALGDAANGVNHLQQALSMFKEISDQATQSTCLSDLGAAYLDLGDLTSARESLEESLAIKEAIGDTDGHAATLRCLGIVEQRAGNSEWGRRLLTEAIQLAEEIGNQPLVAEIRADLDRPPPRV
jgi:tetratricopeptide (TPR) repeat protein